MVWVDAVLCEGCTFSGVRLSARGVAERDVYSTGMGDVDVEHAHAVPKRGEGEQERAHTCMRGLVRPRALPRVGRRRETGWPVRGGEADSNDSCGARVYPSTSGVHTGDHVLSFLSEVSEALPRFFDQCVLVFLHPLTLLLPDHLPLRYFRFLFLSGWALTDDVLFIRRCIRSSTPLFMQREGAEGRGVYISGRVPLLVCRDACGLIGR
jgi:hypothetical protein